ncbi:MAG: nucleoside deaminase [Planctomycetota bacterium]|nr:MAG: nucleoside deaminase [Planctomycetota bacterium]
MRDALAQAREAEVEQEVPVGALVVVDGRVVARAHNRTRALLDPTAHAEILALRAATAELRVGRLDGAVVYTTLEPCFMCAGALLHARVARVVFAARDPKFGACVSLGRVLDDPRANHRAVLVEGVLADESAALLQQFFRRLRGTTPPGGNAARDREELC